MSNEPESPSESVPPAPVHPSPPPQQSAGPVKSEKRLVAGLLGILGIVYGGWGIHKFYLGYTREGVIQLLLCLACGIGTIIGIIEGIIYLTKSDADFEQTYVIGRKPWF